MAVMPSIRGFARAFPHGTATLTAVVLSSAATMLAACTASSSVPDAPQATGNAAAKASAPQRLDWQPCTVSGASMQCASLAVPLDYRHPSGRKITLALSMVPATAPASERQGDLLVNPGGPGGPELKRARGQGLAGTSADWPEGAGVLGGVSESRPPWPWRRPPRWWPWP